jgi:hypothetical protein
MCDEMRVVALAKSDTRKRGTKLVVGSLREGVGTFTAKGGGMGRGEGVTLEMTRGAMWGTGTGRRATMGAGTEMGV